MMLMLIQGFVCVMTRRRSGIRCTGWHEKSFTV